MPQGKTVVKKQRLKGLSNIHIAIIEEGGTHATPVKVEGAKSISAELSFEAEEFESDNVIDHNDYIFTGGEGTMTLKSMALSEFKLLFNNSYVKGGVEINTKDVAPNCAILFERLKLDRKNKRLYVIYNNKFAPAGIKGQSAAKPGTEEVDELKFSVGEFTDGKVVYFIDTDDPKVSQDQITNWYKQVQFIQEPDPEELELREMKVNNIKKQSEKSS
ncbi:MAG: hypothetical protein KH415_20020 [Clostridium sp.]|nr:hypothetical protein [Clostridium sp.]